MGSITPEEYDRLEYEELALLGVYGRSEAQRVSSLRAARAKAGWPWCACCAAPVEHPAEGWLCPECGGKLPPVEVR